MKRISMIVALVLGCVFSVQAGRVVTDSIQSKVLGATVKFNVYLPDGFNRGTDKYPSVYLLHGFTDTYSAWAEKGNMQLVADELISSEEAVPMVIFMPNAGGPDVNNTWNGYFNMPGWNYEDFFYTEFLPTVEEKYRCIGDKEHRAVMGLSMGGGGSAAYAQRHPDMFSSCYIMSGWLEADGGRVGPNGEKGRVYYVTESVKEMSAIRYVKQADDATKERLRSVKWFIDCGDDDFLLDLSEELHRAMRQARIKNEFRVRNGVHNWEYWHNALRLALPFASRNFSK